METIRGTIRKLGLEGGLWALMTDDGRTIELVEPPAELCRDGARAEIVAERRDTEVTIGMVGDAVRVDSYTML